ncbi:SGNH/GDSL hydrolase family protein [Pseudodesulfovibrio portus]|uniref:SGNH/GDSL hydrolase family protein n=1 Tax=Pseudodesulfovibrio portus TaxID=231439 RepID=A0ABM8AP43_9BACT|nr:SGNH/GDSL hydrolase family protein [Pseudodesulfovibrio portus]BDQ33189.1 hypothetical protein JCM14722_07310 [Pseudodesulfovibrio portus]
MKPITTYLKNFGIFLISFIVFIEIGCLFYIRYINQSIPLPTYRVVDANNNFWANLDEHFGTWHEPNSTYLHNKSCFVVEYRANSLGMRDRERTRENLSGKPRAVVLGDSFIEGWGNEIGERLTDNLEMDMGREFLNFATSGYFGTIQEWLQYKYMIKQFDHDVVLIGVLPHNDFQDNSTRRAGTLKRRPYLRGTYPNYELFYSQDKLYVRKKSPDFFKSFDFTLREWSSFYRAMRYLGSYRIRNFELQPRWVAEHNDNQGREHSAYYDFDPADWDIMRYSLEQIAKEVGDKPLVVFSIATHSDFVERDKQGGRTAPLSEEFRKLSKEVGFIYCDMLEEMAARKLDAEDVFFVCDDHWSPAGNRIAADLLEPYVAEAFKRAEVK